MESTFPNCLGSSSHMHGACPQALGSQALSDHWSVGDKLNCGLGGYLEKHAAAPRYMQRTMLLG
jgi:hypothetical protein